MNIGILVIATGKYHEFVGPLWASAQTHLLAQTPHRVTFYVHTNAALPESDYRNYRLKVLRQDHLGWPFATLWRYAIFSRTAALTGREDFLYYMDTDMLFNSKVGEEIFSDLVAVKHPGFCGESHAAFPHENRRASSAYTPEDKRLAYYCGGVQGGAAQTYLKVCHELSARIRLDLDRGIMATWHDESHWNAYLAEHPPTKVLDSSYCVPQEFMGKWPVTPKIVAVKKDHLKYQGEALRKGE